MKKLTLTTICAVLAIALMAQAPQGISHQAVIRNATNELVTNSPIGIKVSILQGSAEGIVVYSETHLPISNANGLISFVIGQGTVVNGVFAEIDWAAGPYFIKTDADPTGGSNYTITGTSQVLSVPYALHAKTAESITGGITETDPVFNVWDKSTGIVINENQIADLQNYLTEESDPVFNAWDKSTGIVINENQIADLQPYLTEETDADPTNELQDLSSSKEGNLINLDITNGAGTTIDVSDSDADPANELQTVTQEDYQVTLSQGGGTFMTGVKSHTQAEIDAMTPYNGLTVHNSTTNCINYYFLNNWFEACGTCTPQPSQAEAGNDTIVMDGNLSVNLNANTPEMGEGLWTILSGEGGTFADATDPQTVFTGQSGINYILQWAVATACATIYDEVQVFFWQCGVPFPDLRDNESYNSVLIGNHCWMAENLKYLPSVVGPGTGSNTTPYYYVYGYHGTSVSAANATANYQTYGALYNWPAALTACPSGWHLPTDAEWTALTTYVSSQPAYLCNSNTSYIAKALAATTNWNTHTGTCTVGNNLSANNATGFSGLPGGTRDTGGSFGSMGSYGNWWSSTETGSLNAWSRYLGYNNSGVGSSSYTKGFGFSVRCVRD